MKAFILTFILMAVSSLRLTAQVSIKISIKTLGDSAVMQRRIASASEAYDGNLRSIRDGIKATVSSTSGERKVLLEASLVTLDAIIEQRDTSNIANLLPLVDLLNANNEDESPRIVGTLENSEAQIGLNYFIDAVLAAKLNGQNGDLSETDLDSMVKFYAGNSAQTSELSLGTTNNMLFILGDRVVEYLTKHAADRLVAFYKAIEDARDDARSGPGPDETPIPPSEIPTADQLSRYEAAFTRLEALATQGKPPNATLSPVGESHSRTDIAPVAPKSSAIKAGEFPISVAANEGSTSSTPWPVVAILVVTVTGLLWLVLKNRKL